MRRRPRMRRSPAAPSPTTQRSGRSPSQARRRRTWSGVASWNSSTNRCRNRHCCAAANSSSRSIASGAPSQEVVEVEPPALPLLGLVTRVEIGELGRGPGQPALGRTGRGRVSARAGSCVPSPTRSRWRRRRSRAFPADPPRSAAERAPALCDRAQRGSSRRCSVARRRSCASASAWKVPAVTAASTPSESRRSTSSPAALPGERDREHMAGVGELLADAERDPPGEHARLARTGGSEDRERHARLGDRGALMRVEIVEQPVGHTATVPVASDSRCSGTRATAGTRKGEPRVVFAASQLRSPRGPSPAVGVHCGSPRRRPP